MQVELLPTGVSGSIPILISSYFVYTKLVGQIMLNLCNYYYYYLLYYI